MTTSSETPIAAIVLAAGGSARMGELKQLLALHGRPMVRWAVEAACAADLAQVVVVVGAQAEAVQAALAGLPCQTVVNPGWAAGMSTSLRAGLGALHPGTSAALLILADQPGLTPALLRRLAERYAATRAPAVVPVYRGQRGNPVLWDAGLFPELAAVQGDRGGRALLERHASAVERVEVDDPAVVRDIDTRRDYEQALAEQGEA